MVTTMHKRSLKVPFLYMAYGLLHTVRLYRGLSDDLLTKRQQTRRLRADPHGSQITDKTPCQGGLALAFWPVRGVALGAARARGAVPVLR